MAKRFDEIQFILAYGRAHKAGESADALARILGVTTEIVYGRTFLLRKRGFRLPKLRRSAGSKAPQPTLGDELVFDTAFLRKPLSFTITVTQEACHAN